MRSAGPAATLEPMSWFLVGGGWAAAGIPGLVATPKVLGMPAAVRDRLLTGVPMRRVASLAEVVGPVLYLLSPAAGYMTGQALRLDDGA
jgi:NAD(P)-dependent dehydrogenase (short-subunit alcohol dehydrogenase family)